MNMSQINLSSKPALMETLPFSCSPPLGGDSHLLCIPDALYHLARE